MAIPIRRWRSVDWRPNTRPRVSKSPAIDRPLPADVIARFAADCTAVLPAIDEPGVRLGIAVSGGADSVAMLLLAQAAFPQRIAAATVDHGLRDENAREAAMVAQSCEEHGIAHETLPVHVARGNLQAQARAMRYAALSRWAAREGLKAVATAHHADDQAETVLMRLNRGSGLGGLAGIRRSIVLNESLHVVRPLLGWTKAELIQICDDHRIAYVVDPSNQDDRFDRVAMRLQLASIDWLDPHAIGRSADHLAQAQEALDEWLEIRWQQDVVLQDNTLTYRAHGPRYVRLCLLERAIATFGASPRGSAVAALLDRLERGNGGNLAGVQAIVDSDRWVLRRENPRRG